MYIYVGIIVKRALIFVFGFPVLCSFCLTWLVVHVCQPLTGSYMCLSSCEADSFVRLVYIQLSDFRDIFLCELKVVRLSLTVIKAFSFACSSRSGAFSFLELILVGKFQFCLFMFLAL